MKTCTYLLFTSLFLALSIGQASEPTLIDLTDWHVDAAKGDDANGTGSVDKPFKSINTLLSVNEEFPGFLGEGDTVHLAVGNYDDELVVIDIPRLSIKGVSNGHGIPESILGKVKITANKVTLTNCLFLNAELTLQDVEGVSISDNLFLGTTENSLILLGSSNNSINRNRFESATESCVVIQCNPKNNRPSDDNVFQENYFTHHPESMTSQVVLTNKSSFFKDLFGKKCLSARNRFIRCAFEETIPGQLKNVIADYSTWQIVNEKEYSLKFEDCYFKKANRNTPFISFMIVGEHPNLKWYWDELANDTWVSPNNDDALTGNKRNEFTPFIQFADWDSDGLILETKKPADFKVSAEDESFVDEPPAQPINDSPNVVNAITDIAVYKNAEPSKINLFEVFEDETTADENLKFTVDIDNASLISSEINDGLLTLDYANDKTGMALVTITATDNDSADPQSSKASFHIVIVEGTERATTDVKDWYVDSLKGDDIKGEGSQSSPFKSIDKVLALYAEQNNLQGAGSTIHLSKGKHEPSSLEINIPGLSVEGTLDESGKPVTILGETYITADGVKLVNCEIRSAPLTLLNVENVLVSNNVFSGTTNISLYLLGASNNLIQRNEFSSAIHDCVHIFWDPASGNSSNDNVFLQNYFTHRSHGSTNRVIRVNWATGINSSISARNHFVECAFKETEKGQLLRIIDDDTNWWVVADHKYSVLFEDCYFKRADRLNPFSEFVILKGYPDFTWRWDELINDEWVSSNASWAITGDYKGWHHRPRIRFVDKNGNGKILEIAYNAGLLTR